MERQKHGFDYQAEVIERFGLIKDENYTGKWDAYCEGIPVSIKNPKIGSDIELADFFRQSSIDEDFYMIVGFHDHENKNNIIEEYVLYIPKEEWAALFDSSFNARFKELLDNCSNEHSYDSIWTKKLNF